MKIELKTLLSLLVSLLSAAALLGGFYYTTQIRLDNLEAEVNMLKQEDKSLRRLINKQNKQKRKHSQTKQ